jgi:hypothetical protein
MYIALKPNRSTVKPLSYLISNTTGGSNWSYLVQSDSNISEDESAGRNGSRQLLALGATSLRAFLRSMWG